MFCEQCFVCKILYTVVQGLREGFDKGTAAGGTCFIELYAVYSAVFDLDTFHILTADIEDTVYLRIKESSSVIMRNRLNLTVIQQECGFHQGFTVAGRTGTDDFGTGGQLFIDILDRTDGGF